MGSLPENNKPLRLFLFDTARTNCQAFYKLFKSLVVYIKQHHATGITWNAKGIDSKEALQQIQSSSTTGAPKAAPVPAAGAPPPPPPPLPPADFGGPPPPPPLPQAATTSKQAPDMTQVFGQLNQGVKHIAPVLNITRVWSAITSVGHLRKCCSIATAYARVRAVRAGTQLLQNNAMHVAQLARIHLLYRA